MTHLIIPAFFAGILTFLAPCTLPLLPAYIGFIGGLSGNDLFVSEKLEKARRKIFMNGLMYVMGFSAVFILMGTLLGAGGSLIGPYRPALIRFGGLLIIFFGFYLAGFIPKGLRSYLQRERRFHVVRKLSPGKPISSFFLGATFAFGWTPCVGPILGSILVLAASTSTVIEGAFLLAVFSLGLAIPFLLIALGGGWALGAIRPLQKYINIIARIGGILLIVLGILFLSGKFGVYVKYFYQWFNILQYDALLNYF